MILVTEESASSLPPQASAPRLHIVADLGVRIERQMVGQQVDAVADQAGDTPPLDTDDWLRLALPEITVMREQRTGAGGGRGVDQCLARGDAADEFADLGAGFDLKAVGAIIVEVRDLEEGVAELAQVV